MKILTVVSNLISNAIKYTPFGSTITLSCSQTDEGVKVCVEDQGSGIATDELKKIFQRYYRSKERPTISGFGIGLYLCSEIITRQGGKIWAESNPGEGAKFYFTLREKIENEHIQKPL
ncbi:MAG: ATP-binding protein [Chryseobacterium sp.]|nr:MAG: ATP-binding protein [Chryseobacterium sp.]